MNIDESVRLKGISYNSGQFAVLAGVSCWLFGPMAISATLQGDWLAPLALLIPAGIVVVGRWLDRFLGEGVILYADRVGFPGRGGSQDFFEWSEVEGIFWPGSRDREIPVRIRIPPSKRWPIGSVLIELKYFSREDGLTLIQYLRKAGANVEQRGWPRFCLNRAVPLADYCQRKRAADGTALEDTTGSLLVRSVRRFWRFVERHPFWGGMLLPIVLALLIPRMLSRKMWWMTSALLSVSAIINIRLIWGRWAWFFTELTLGFAGTMFVLGLFAPKHVPGQRDRELRGTAVFLWLATLLVGMPLLGNAIALGWVPKQVARFAQLLGVSLMLAPLFVITWKQSQSAKRRDPVEEADALGRWEIYERTGNLPEAESAS